MDVQEFESVTKNLVFNITSLMPGFWNVRYEIHKFM